MLADPVFKTIAEYKAEYKGDVIRHELAIRAEILRLQQYRKYTYQDAHRLLVDDLIKVMTKNLNQVLSLIPAYLDLKFKEEVKKTSFWDRGSLKANCLNWKYTFYTKERHAIAVELTNLLRDKAIVTVKQVKESAT